jgi:hypothetical protein
MRVPISAPRRGFSGVTNTEEEIGASNAFRAGMYWLGELVAFESLIATKEIELIAIPDVRARIEPALIRDRILTILILDTPAN